MNTKKSASDIKPPSDSLDRPFTRDAPTDKFCQIAPSQGAKIQSLGRRLINSDPQTRSAAYTELFAVLQREQDIVDEELANNLRSNYDLLMGEISAENQKLVLRLFRAIEELRLEACSIELTCKTFWYNFLNNYLSSTNESIKDDARKLLDLLLARTDRSAFLALAVEFLTTNNPTIHRIILYIMNSNFQRFESWAANLKPLLQALDRLLLSPIQEIKSATIELLKRLALVFSLNSLKTLNNAGPPLFEEIKAFLAAQEYRFS